MTALFVTATGTDVGKTFVTAGLVGACRRAGVSVAPRKPVLSGYDPAEAAASDAGRLVAALGLEPTPARIAAVAPQRFAAPLSPDMAAVREGRTIDRAQLLAASRPAPEGVTLVEGVGGVMVPLDAAWTVRDWIAASGLPALLVAGSYLGTLSHTLTAALALRDAGVTLAAVVVSASPLPPVPLEETCEALAARLGAPVHALRRDPDEAAFDRLARDLGLVLD